MPFLHYILSFEGTSYKNLYDRATRSFIQYCFYQLLHQQVSFFHKFLELHSTLSEKSIFIMNFPFLFRFTETLPHPLNGQNPLSMTKAFCRCSLMLSCQEGKQKSHHIFQSFSSKEHPKIRLISMMVLKQFEKSGNLKN